MIEMQPTVATTRLTVSDGKSVQTSTHVPLVRPIQWTSNRHSRYLMQWLTFASPLALVDMALSTAILAATGLGLSFVVSGVATISIVSLLAIQAIILPIAFMAFGLYCNVGMHPVEELKRVVTATLFGLTLMIAIAVWSQPSLAFLELLVLGANGLLCALILPSARHLLRCWLGRQAWWRQPLVVISHSDRAQAFIDELEKEKHLGLRPVGFIQSFQDHWERNDIPSQCLGDEEDLPEAIERHHIFWGLVDTKCVEPDQLQSFVDRHHRGLPHLITVAGDRGDSHLFVHGITCGFIPGVHLQSRLSLLMPNLVKRFVDLACGLVALTLFSPVLIFLAIAVKLSGPGNIFYSQERIGIGGRTFRIWKFRSMVKDADRVLHTCLMNNAKLRDEWRQTQKLTNDPRVTTIGKFLRRTSLDELPQLWNVLNGTMSLVGPRPIVRSEIERYGDVYWLYTRTKPGITGLWQVSGRNHTTYQERLHYDSFYVRNWSVWLDWYILLKTFRVVVLCEGAY
jgi:Undecaprenyl-phosphate galactose phosphotransferase WbaP